jgi:hypothetical protein
MAAVARAAGQYRTTDDFMIRYSTVLVEDSGIRVALPCDIGVGER